MNGFLEIEDYDCEEDYLRAKRASRAVDPIHAMRERLKEALPKVIAPHGHLYSFGPYDSDFTSTAILTWEGYEYRQYIQMEIGGLKVTKSVPNPYWSQICANAPSIALPVKR
jgi:hypothetical protein